MIFRPSIPCTDRSGRPIGGDISSVALPDDVQPTSAFLSCVFPGRKIEYLGRDSYTLGLVGDNTVLPTSLFFQAVHACFTNHHALTLRPEVLMHLIVHEIATTVHKYPNEFRHLFTSSQDQIKIEVRHDILELGHSASPWGEAISLFDPELRQVVPAGIMEHLMPEFTTSTTHTRAASLVAFMDAAKQFYNYRIDTWCGIPEIRLAGTPEDYRKILRAAAALSEAFASRLNSYFTHLLPVLETLCRQAEGAPFDSDFWSSIYKFKSESGGDRFNGWITTFINSIQSAKDGQLIPKAEDAYDWHASIQKKHFMPGLELGSVPSHVSTAPFTWHYLTDPPRLMLFAGGILAVDNHEGTLMPGLSYAVLHNQT